jgi:hypothetical protein
LRYSIDNFKLSGSVPGERYLNTIQDIHTAS